MLQGEVRLVRCPKCRNILPEFNSYSLYQCGVCGTILRAKSTKPHEQKQASEHGDTIHAEDEESPHNNNDRDISIREKKEESERDNISESPGLFHNDASTMDDHLDKLAEEDASKSACFSDPGKEENTRGGKIKLKEEESGELLSKMDELINHLSRFSLNTREEEKEEQTAAALSSRPYAHSCNLATTDGLHLQWREGRRSMLLHSAPLRRNSASFVKLKNGSNFSYDGAFREGGYSRPVGIYSGRRRCRAVGGGAPFVVCSHCWELLEIGSMKGGRVRCGSCMKPVVVVMDCGEEEKKKKKRVGFNESGLGIKEGKGKQWRKEEGNKGGYLRPPPGAPLQMHFDYSSNNLGGWGVEERDEGGGGGLVGRIKRGIKDLHRLRGF